MEVIRGKKTCAICSKPKMIHFFSPHEWKSAYSRCRACLQKDNKRTPQTGREYWRRSMKAVMS